MLLTGVTKVFANAAARDGLIFIVTFDVGRPLAVIKKVLSPTVEITSVTLGIVEVLELLAMRTLSPESKPCAGENICTVLALRLAPKFIYLKLLVILAANNTDELPDIVKDVEAALTFETRNVLPFRKALEFPSK